MSKPNMEANEWKIKSWVGLCVGMLESKYMIILWTLLCFCSNFPNTFYIFIKYPQGQFC